MDSYTPSVTNIQSNETYRKVKAWYNLYLSHKYIPPESVATLNYNKTPFFYRIFINEVRNVSSQIPQSDMTRLYLKLSMTFFNKSRKKFYGRTYVSNPLALVSQNGPYQLEHPVNVYFYSTIEKGEDNLLVVEAQLLELANRNVLVRDQSLGWTWMDVYNPQSLNLRPVTFYSGTPRILLDSDITNQLSPISTNLTFRVTEIEGFDQIMTLFDEAILCGADDILPGVIGKTLPNSPTDEIWPPRLENTVRIFLEDIVVEVPFTLENDIIRSAQTYRASQFNLTPEIEKKLTDVFISERRFIAVYHNSWTAVNSRKFKNSILLHRDQKDKTKNLFVFSGALDCDGVFVDEYATLILQVEYTITLPKPDGTKTTWNIVVGWKPFVIPSLGANQITIKETLIRGPGRTPTNQKLYEPNPNISDLITIHGRLDLAKLARTPSMTDLGLHDFPQKPSQTYQPTSTDNEELLRLQVLLAKKEKAFEEMKRQYQQELNAIKPKEQEKFYNQSQNQPKDFQNRISSDFEEHYQNEAAKTRMEVESIKKILTEMQTQEKFKQEEYNKFEPNRFDAEKLKTMDYYMTQMSPTKPFEDLGTTQITPQPHTREISRADKALLIQSGIKGILDSVDDYGAMEMNEEKALSVEAKDAFKASVFLIQFLALKASPNAIPRDSFRPLDFGQDSFELPSKVYFTFNFFDVPDTKTEIICLEKPQDMPYDVSLLKYGVPYYLVRDAYLKNGTDTREPILRYEIDPSVDHQVNRHLEFAKYLFAKSLTIDIWDADSLMLFGSVKVPLRGLLRQGGQVATFSKEFDIIEPNFMRPKGSLQLLLKNVGKQPINDILKPKTAENTINAMFGDKKKVKSKHKINLPEEFKAGAPISRFDDQEEMALSPEQRKQERINRYKMASIDVNTNIMMTSEEFQKEKHRRELREIENFRDVKKVTTLRTAINQLFKEERVINVKFGKVEVIPLEVANYYNHDAAFTVHIQDPDEIYIGQSELSVISIPAEWKYWVEKKRFAVPPEWNMIAMNTNNFVLKAGERCEILLKFLTLRNYNMEFQREYTNGRVGKNDTRRRDYIASRIINVSVSETNGRLVTGTKLEIVPSFPIVDHIFRFFEQENQNVRLYLPALYHYSIPPANQPVLKLNYQKAAVEWLNDKEISLQLKVPAAQTILKFNLLAYSDIYFTELLGNWVIEIHAYAGVAVPLNIGQLTTTKLTLSADTSRMVKCYVSHPNMAFFPNPFDKPFALIPATINAITLNTRLFSVKNQMVLVNCVDINTKELVYAWLIKLIGTEPEVTRKYELTVRCGIESNQKFLYENRSTSFSIFGFISSHPDILQPIERNVPIEGGQKESIRVRIASRDQPGIAEVCLFASDTEERIFECLLFQIKYIN